MVAIGLTGGIGMGKSTVAEYLQRRGERIVDTDALARELVEPGTPALEEIRNIFGNGVIDFSGQLDRKALAELVFDQEEARRTLEAILHPKIRAAWRERLDLWRRTGVSRAFVVIPLLYETGADAEVDKIICLACSKNTQAQRLAARGWNPEEISRRNAAQWPVQNKMDRADWLIWNESTVEVCEEQCARILTSS